jgi:NAD dependent epimerase/dehydratase family enzyme
VLRIPAFALRALFGEMGVVLLLESARVAPARLAAAGFQFTRPHLEPALREALA